MSWLSENYEKAALGGAVVVALALGAVALNNKTGLSEAFTLGSHKKNKETGVPGLSDMQGVKKSLETQHSISQADVDGRKVDLFTGVSLFAKKDAPDSPVDLLKSEPVHQGIPNTWWLKYGIDPGFSDSPDRDPDKDGFTNREEYIAKTDPTDFKDLPDPVVKLKVNSVKTTQVHIKPTDFGNGNSLFKLESKSGARVNRMAPNPVKPGQVIQFLGPLMQKRFKYAAVEKEKLPSGITESIWVIEDLKPNKAGKKYRFDKRGNMPGAPNRQFGIMDSTVELSLQALGQGGNPFKLEENTRFSLPFDAKAKDKPYLLKKVDRDNLRVEVEYTDKAGKRQLHVMPYTRK